MSKELADAIDEDLSAEESVRSRYANLMSEVDADSDPERSTSLLYENCDTPEITVTSSESPNVSVDRESDSFRWAEFSQFIREETSRR